MQNLGLYIHIPFCKSKCLYCDFNSYINKEDIQDDYIKCVIKEIENQSSIISSYNLKSIFIGGGTPTYLNFQSFQKLLGCLKQYVHTDMEYSCEANPGTLSYEKLALMKEYGINRLSIGLQSWDDDILKRLGRIHNRSQFIDNYNLARKVGFNNINIDIMFSIEGQTIENFKETLENVFALNPEHISCYGLIIEEGTPFYELQKAGKLIETDEETDRAMYYIAVDKLRRSGYVRYEISNFAKRGYECWHNINYWQTGPYLGIGAGAHSYMQGKRFFNEAVPEKYIRDIKRGRLPVAGEELLSEDDKMSEFMFMGLRMEDGIDIMEFQNRFGYNIMDIYCREIDGLINKGLLKISEGRVALTDVGIDLSNQVFVEFLR